MKIYYNCFSGKILSSECKALPLEWNTVRTEVTFPVDHGTILEVKCAQESHKMTGSNIVTCDTTQAIRFTFEKMPICLRKLITFLNSFGSNYF